MEDKIEEALITLRAVASLLEFTSYTKDDVRDKEFALEFLSKQVFSCVNAISDALAYARA